MTTYSTLQKARKPFTCHGCNQSIERGAKVLTCEEYSKAAGRLTFNFCGRCNDLIDLYSAALPASIEYGSLLNFEPQQAGDD